MPLQTVVKVRALWPWIEAKPTSSSYTSNSVVILERRKKKRHWSCKCTINSFVCHWGEPEWYFCYVLELECYVIRCIWTVIWFKLKLAHFWIDSGHLLSVVLPMSVFTNPHMWRKNLNVFAAFMFWMNSMSYLFLYLHRILHRHWNRLPKKW